MRGLMMDGPLTLDAILRRAETVFGGREIVTRGFDGPPRRTDYATLAERARRLAAGLERLGVRPGDRVATLCMNHDRHLEAYFGVPAMGAILHTLNPRLHTDDLALIVGDAGDGAIIVDEGLLPVLEALRERVDPGTVIVAGDGPPPAGALAFEDLLADDPGGPRPEPDERDAAFLCYTSGTTGAPKGVLYSHRALVLHSLASGHADALDVREADTVMPVVTMFHVNAWGLPFTSAMAGARQVLPGPRLDVASLLAAIEEEQVTVAAGVPTVWLALLAALDAEPGAHDVSSLRTVIVGGSAAPRAMIEGFERRHGLHVLHAWGMTEMTPLGTVSRVPPDLAGAPDDERFRVRAAQGRAVPFVEVRARGDEGLVPEDGTAMGELEVRGPFVAAAYYGEDGSSDCFTDDGWFRTGDIVTIDERGIVRITDREKDLVKSGSEWISSVALENALMGHPAVAEAAVIAIPDEIWQERPLAVVVLHDGASATAGELIEHLRPSFASWWLPDGVEFVDALPRTATGKFKKAALRERFGGGPPG